MGNEENDIVEVDGIAMLMEVIADEREALRNENLTAEEHQKAFNNFLSGTKVLVEIQKIDVESNNNEARNELERINNEARNELEKRRLEIEAEANELNAARLELDKEVENNRKIDSNVRKYLEIGSLLLTGIGLLTGVIMTKKTLDVNMESVIRDKDAVQRATKIFDHFAFNRK